MGAKKRVFLGNQEDGVIRIRHQIVDLRLKKTFMSSSIFRGRAELEPLRSAYFRF